MSTKTLLALVLLSAPLAAQQGPAAPSSADPKTKKVLTVDDYSKWRTIDGAQLSPDGKWVAYGVRFTNVVTPDAKPALHIYNIASGKDTTIADATNAQFSSDSKWVVYQIEITPPSARPARGGAPGGSDSTADTTRRNGAQGNQPQRRTEVRELATGKVQSWQDIATATFSPTASHILLRRRPPTPPGGAGGAGGGGGGPGGPGGGFGGRGGDGGSNTVRAADVLLVSLATSKSQFIGSVGLAEFNRTGTSLAYTVESQVKDGNGLYIVNLGNGTTLPVENEAKTYNRLTWNDAGTSVAVLKGADVPRMREKSNVLVIFPNVAAVSAAPGTQTPVALDPAVTSNFPKGFVVSDRASLDWSDDNKRVFFGIMRQGAAPDTGRRRSTDSVPDVDVWRTNDERIQSLQMIRADQDRNFTYRQAMDVTTGKFIPLADTTMRELQVAPDGNWAVGRDMRGYVIDYGVDKADIYRVNTMTGERTLIEKAGMIGQFALGISSDSKHYISYKDGKFIDYNLDAGTSSPLAAPDAKEFVDAEFDYPGPKPSYGIAGFSKDGKGVIVNGRYDLWYLPYGGGAAKNLTNGAGVKDSMRLRWVRTTPPDPMAPRAEREGRVIDLAKPVTLSAYGDWTKKSGYYELNGASLKPVVYEDAIFSTPQRALKADQYLFTRQTFAEFPDLRVSGAAFATAKKISDVNPQQAEYKWGHRILFDYKLKDGQHGQGILALPDDYKQGEKRPMIVTFYEKNSQNMHRYNTPNYVTGMGAIPAEAVSKGYLTMLPDVYYRTGQSHSDQLEAVEAATRKVIELGYVDPKKIAVHGHSYGGEGAAFISTRSRLFAAVGMGAGVTDLYSDFAQSWGWAYQVNSGSGQNAFSYYMEGQGRWGFSPWEKPEVYNFESALMHAPEVTQPILIMHGTADPTVSFQEGLSFYQALRYNKKEAILLAYPNEGHGLRGLANRKDLTVRYFQFFDHYLLGTPAPKWMTDGVPYLVKGTAADPRTTTATQTAVP